MNEEAHPSRQPASSRRRSAPGIARRGFLARAVAVVVAGVAPTGRDARGAQSSEVPSRNMYGLVGKIISVEGQRDELIAILLDGAAELPGCLSYVVAEDSDDANAIWVTEVWDSEASHRASLSLPGVRRAMERGKPLIAEFGDRIVTTPIGGRGL